MSTSQDTYVFQIKAAAIASLVVTALLYFLTSARWFGFYGWAMALLAATILFAFPLLNRLRDKGRNRAWALLFIVPAALTGVVQIAYWFAFFKFGPATPVPGIARELFWNNIGFAVPYAVAALVALWLWLFASAARSEV